MLVWAASVSDVSSKEDDGPDTAQSGTLHITLDRGMTIIDHSVDVERIHSPTRFMLDHMWAETPAFGVQVHTGEI